MREQYAGRPADRIEEAIAREAAILRQLRAGPPGRPPTASRRRSRARRSALSADRDRGRIAGVERHAGDPSVFAWASSRRVTRSGRRRPSG